LIVVDEAYYEIGALAGDARAWTAAPLLASAGNRLVVLRTFSKLFGLAGLRVGYGLCSPEIAGRLQALKAPYNVNIVGQIAALAALSDLDWLRERAQLLVTERERVARTLMDQHGLRVWPSAANFLLVEVAPDVAEPTASEQRRDKLWQALLTGGILTRRLTGPRLEGVLRVTIGLPEQNDAFCAALARARQTSEGEPQWAN
ncbi:MAG TPA: aminotransferase class I/II-fold pyridoxal phosphate-dependent enzyme, partial [Ktedonobacterales bacterium]